MFQDQTIKEYIQTLGSAAPTPGGGAVSALDGAQAAALFAMVAALTVKNAKYASAKEEMEGYLRELQEEESWFLAAADRDKDVFSGILAAYRLPKGTDEEKAARRQAIQEALVRASEAPLAVGLRALALLRFARPLMDRGNASAVSDVAVGLQCLRAAVFSSFYNVKINLASIKDAAYVNQARQKMQDAGARLNRECSQLLEELEARWEAFGE